MAPEKEEGLIRQSQVGNQEAFAELVHRYRQRIFFLCLQILGDRELAEDATQETFIRAYQHVNRFKFQSRFYTWIYRIAVNTSINSFRKQKASQASSLSDIPHASESEKESDLEQKEIYDSIEKGLKKLSSKHRTVLELFDLKGLSHQQIAEELNINPSTSRSRLYYARKQMKKFLLNYFQENP